MSSSGDDIAARMWRGLRRALGRLTLNILIAAVMLLGCILLCIADPEPVARLSLSVFDAYLRAAPRAVDTSFLVRVMAIDEA